MVFYSLAFIGSSGNPTILRCFKIKGGLTGKLPTKLISLNQVTKILFYFRGALMETVGGVFTWRKHVPHSLKVSSFASLTQNMKILWCKLGPIPVAMPCISSSNLLMNLSPSSKISLAISSRKKVHMELAVQPTSALIQFEKSLQVKYDQLVHREEILWFQKSRENWVKLGNKNTKFFHTQTIIQRRRNKVTGLFIADTWCTDPRLIK